MIANGYVALAFMEKYGKEKERGVRGKASEKALNPATFAAACRSPCGGVD
jgi:hypothetical protein